MTAVVCVIAVTACHDFLTVPDPNVINSQGINRVDDARTLSLSAQQDFATAYGRLINVGAYFTWEAWPATTFPEYNQIAQRTIVTGNTLLTSQAWAPISIALASADRVRNTLASTSGAASNVDLARGALFAGYALETMAEDFCSGVIAGGPELTTAALLDSAIVRFSQAITVGTAAEGVGTSGDRTDASQIVGAALVGRARAQLQAGHNTEAMADAALVPAGFEFDLVYADDPSALDRVGNVQWDHTFAKRYLVVPPTFRVSDPRVPWVPPNAGETAQDGITPFFHQAKYTGYAVPVRLASRLEADYIAAEASGTSAQLALIATRRSANGQPAYGGATDATSVLTELMLQRSLEFYLEGKHLGDARRHPGLVPGVPAPGTPYFKASFSAVGTQSCLPIPDTETSNNSNFKKTS